MDCRVPAVGYHDINKEHNDCVGGLPASECTESFREVIYPAFKFLGQGTVVVGAQRIVTNRLSASCGWNSDSALLDWGLLCENLEHWLGKVQEPENWNRIMGVGPDKLEHTNPPNSTDPPLPAGKAFSSHGWSWSCLTWSPWDTYPIKGYPFTSHPALLLLITPRTKIRFNFQHATATIPNSGKEGLLDFANLFQ